LHIVFISYNNAKRLLHLSDPIYVCTTLARQELNLVSEKKGQLKNAYSKFS